MRKPLRVAFAALALSSSLGFGVVACERKETLGEKIEEAGEEIGDEIDDNTDEDN